MKKNIFYPLILIVAIAVSSCSSARKTYFTSDIRNKVEHSGVSLTKIQYYIDRDLELRREISKDEAQIISGKVKFENGHYINIITLKKNTPGICTNTFPEKLLVSFETGDGKYLTFGRTKNARNDDPYRILAFNWLSDGDGIITYEGKKYHIIGGTNASIMIKANVLRKSEVNQRQMKGVTVQ
jgi:hypothetical protein